MKIFIHTQYINLGFFINHNTKLAMSIIDVSNKAGSIYYLLEQENRLSVEQLIQQTDLGEAYILMALGWLARDNRIVFLETGGALSVQINRPPMTEIHY